MILKPGIIAGGQSGVDRAAMDFAIANNIPLKGWCPKGCKAEDGVIDKKYKLIEIPQTEPKFRTIKNITKADAVLAFLFDSPDKGTFFAIEYAEKIKKPFYMVFLKMKMQNQIKGVIRFLDNNSVRWINIIGPRESNSKGIYSETYLFLSELWHKIN